MSKRHFHTRPRDGAQTERSEEGAPKSELNRAITFSKLPEAASNFQNVLDITTASKVTDRDEIDELEDGGKWQNLEEPNGSGSIVLTTQPTDL
jgi:hypothetical protein